MPPLHSDESSSSPSPSNDDDNKPQTPRWFRFVSTTRQLFLQSIRDDYPLWMASGWLIWNKQQLLPASPSSSRQSTWNNAVVDFALMGSLLLWKKARDGNSFQSDDKNTTSRDIHPQAQSTKGVSVMQELRDMLSTTTEIPPPPPSLLVNIQKGADRPPRAISPTSMSLVPPPPPIINQAQQQPPQADKQQPQRYVELMVHNVSHTDLVLSLDAPPLQKTKKEDDSFCLCRPRFSAFDAYTKRIVNFVTGQNVTTSDKSKISDSCLPSDTIVRVPRYERFDDHSRNYQIKPEPSNPLDKIPLGFRLTGTATTIDTTLKVTPSQLKDLRIRGKDACRITNMTQEGSSSELLHINAVFFPLLATLIPIWQAKMKEKYSFLDNQSTSIKKVLILVSGVGTPRNWTHSVNGNSTYECARLMKLFLHTICPELVVVHLHSPPERDIFRYDANIAFVQQKLLPHINAYRDAHAKGLPYPDEVVSTERSDSMNDDLPFSTEWGKSFHITLSFADGSPARNYAIQAALRSYKPTFFHFWQLKTFWHETKIVDSDVEEHSFEEMETLPPIETSQMGQEQPHVLQVVEEMKRFRDEMVSFLAEGDDSNDIRRFWLRKTQKPVLAVLAVKVASGGLKLYRGTNMEVSMPTGSLCAERNVIGSALADNPGLKRQDLKLIAVLAVPVPKRGSMANSSLPRLHSVNSMSSFLQEEDGSNGGRPPMFPSSRKSSLGEEEDWAGQDAQGTVVSAGTLHVPAGMPQPQNSPSESSTPLRRIPLYKPQQQSKTQKRTVIIHSDADINPLAPCGACNEWLKKIAETNPYFTIVTFTDSACNGVYCSPCEE